MRDASSHTTRLFLSAAIALLQAASLRAAAPGIKGQAFNLSAAAAYITQPDGASVYSWGYGCANGSTGSATFAPNNVPAGSVGCPEMQIPGPTLIVNAGTTFTVTLANKLPNAAGNTSILFPGFQVAASGGVAGLLTKEAAPLGTVTYTVTVPSSAGGTHAYYSGTQADLQVEMGLYGAIIVVPTSASSNCGSQSPRTNLYGINSYTSMAEKDYRHASAAYDHAKACYDREYLFQFSEMDPRIHREALTQSTRSCTGCMQVATEPYVPAYFMINGRSMPDLMDSNYALQYPHQPYNGNPHMHPGEQVLLRIVGQGRWQHPFHEHGNHVRVLGRDGNLITSATSSSALAGPLLFTTSTTPGQAMDGIFYWTGKGVNWDVYGHTTGVGSCTADANGYNTGNPAALNYFEWCQDHNKPLQAKPFGAVGANGPVTLPEPTILANGAWFGGSPYLGAEATVRAVGSTGTTPPSGTIANSPTDEAGFAFMWHSHNEREITTNNVFPGGMLMMMLVDSREFVINESN